MRKLLARRGLLYLMLLALLTVIGFNVYQNLGNVRELIDKSPSSISRLERHRIEVEYTRFLEGLASYVAGAEAVDHDQMTELFDVLWARADRVLHGEFFESTRRQSNIAEVCTELLVVLQRIETDIFALERDDRQTFMAIRTLLLPFQSTLADMTASFGNIEAQQIDNVRDALQTSVRTLDQLGWMVGLVVTVLLAIFAVEVVTARRAEAALAEHRDHLEGIVTARTAELQQEKQRVEQALDRERELAALQRKFVSMVSHEFRTPLAIIDGTAQRITRRIDKLSKDKITTSLGQITRSVKRLINMMESMLTASRLEAGTIKIAPVDCDITGLVGEICDEQRQITKTHHIHVDIDALPAAIQADEQLLRQIVCNLLSNAIKYSPDAENVWVEGRTEGEMAVVSVRDEGVGIPSEELPKLFGRFFRASTSSGIAGTGIGLNLIKHLVELHGGHIDVTTEAGEGSTFAAHLPITGPVDDEGVTDVVPSVPADPPSVEIAA